MADLVGDVGALLVECRGADVPGHSLADALVHGMALRAGRAPVVPDHGALGQRESRALVLPHELALLLRLHGALPARHGLTLLDVVRGTLLIIHGHAFLLPDGVEHGVASGSGLLLPNAFGAPLLAPEQVSGGGGQDHGDQDDQRQRQLLHGDVARLKVTEI